jgi:hypothetical protein
LRAIIARAKALPAQIPAGYVIRKPNGKPYTARGFSAIWQRLMTKYVDAGGKRFTFHDLRGADCGRGAQPARSCKRRDDEAALSARAIQRSPEYSDLHARKLARPERLELPTPWFVGSLKIIGYFVIQ